jgi:indole-3-glycerol phosphate synthase
LDTAALSDLQALAAELGMAALVEVHTLAELEAVLPLQPRLVGVNNRDLNTFQVSLETTRWLRPYIPAGVTLVAESGINRADDVAYLAEDANAGEERASVDAILVGEALVTAPDIAARVRELAGASVEPTLSGMKKGSRYCEG